MGNLPTSAIIFAFQGIEQSLLGTVPDLRKQTCNYSVIRRCVNHLAGYSEQESNEAVALLRLNHLVGRESFEKISISHSRTGRNP